MRARWMAVLGAALVLPGSVGLASAAQASVPASRPTGNPQGLALLARVHAAYQRVPAVVSSARFGSERARFTLLLRGGVATAEAFVGVTPAGTTMLVARGSGPTYAREAGSRCWRRLAASDSQSLEDVGLRFPDAFRMRVEQPRRVGAAWLLRVATQGRYPGERASFTMHINAATMLLESQTGSVGGHTLTERVHALTHQPRLPTPSPGC